MDQQQRLSGGAKFAIIFIFMLIFSMIGVGIWWFMSQQKDDKSTKKSSKKINSSPVKQNKPKDNDTEKAPQEDIKSTPVIENKPEEDIKSTPVIEKAPSVPAPGSLAVANFAEGMAVKCKTGDPKGNGSGAVYRYAGNNVLRHYPDPTIASSWDKNWGNAVAIEDCTGLTLGQQMPLNLNLGSSIISGTDIAQEQYLISNNGKYKLIMQSDGNLVMYRTAGGVEWASNTDRRGTSPYKASFQGDGNFVVYSASGPTWASNTDGRKSTQLIIQDDGKLVIYNNGTPVWTSMGSSIPPGTDLLQEQYLISNNGKFKMIMQSDGNLVIYKTSGGVQWASNTDRKGTPPYKASFQGDGNFVVYSTSGPTWASNTDGRKSTQLIMQDNGNLVIYNNGTPVWDTTIGIIQSSLFNFYFP